MSEQTPQQPEPTDQPPATWPSAGYEIPAATGPYVVAPKTSNNAIVALVLAIASWVICPLIPAIVALVFANNAKKEIAASQGRVGGEGMVTASVVVAWINIGVTAALVVLGILVVVLIAVAGGMSA
jgi:hypothetical protein